MKIDFTGKDDNSDDSMLLDGDYEKMMKLRAKRLPKIQESIQETLKNYAGESIVILIVKEDENGKPENTRMLMAGVSRMESQVFMSKSLDKASSRAVEMLMESAKGDTKAMLAIASTLIKLLEK